MFGDNKSVVDSVMTPHCNMHKRHVALYFHRVRETMSFKITNYLFVDRNNYPDETSTKHWAHHDIWNTLKPIFFLTGDTIECLNNNSLSLKMRSKVGG